MMNGIQFYIREEINKASYIKHQKKNFDSLKTIAESFTVNKRLFGGSVH